MTRSEPTADPQWIQLPSPVSDGGLAVERALRARRSVREFDPGALTLTEVSQLLWAAQGVTGRLGFRTAPSAGALYPLEVCLVAGDVAALADGVWRYAPHDHAIRLVAPGDRRAPVARAALSQGWVAEAPAILVLAAVYERTTAKYGRRGERYVHIEVGHAVQNVYLQANSLGLGTTIVGAFDDSRLREELSIPREEFPLCLLPVGRPARP